MDDFNGRFWIAFWAIVAATLTATVLGGCAIACRHVEKMAELGYVETMLPGSSVPHWTRSGEAGK